MKDRNRGTSRVAKSTPGRRGRPPKPREVIPFVSGIPEGDVVEVHMDEIDLDNTELEFRVDRRLKDLMEDIRTNGQQFPVILRRQVDGRYQVVSGFRRCRTIRALQWPTVKAIVRADLDDDMAFRVSFLENERRKSLTGVDKANAIVKLRLRGKNDEEIQDIYGIGQRQVERYKQVSTFPPLLKEAIIDHRLKTTHGLALMKAHNAHGPVVDLGEWVDRVHAEGLSVRTLTRLLNSHFGKPRARKRYMEKYANGGFRLFPMRYDPRSTSPPDRRKMVERLRAAVEMLEAADPRYKK